MDASNYGRELCAAAADTRQGWVLTALGTIYRAIPRGGKARVT